MRFSCTTTQKKKKRETGTRIHVIRFESRIGVNTCMIMRYTGLITIKIHNKQNFQPTTYYLRDMENYKMAGLGRNKFLTIIERCVLTIITAHQG